jgi:hypothetical protein
VGRPLDNNIFGNDISFAGEACGLFAQADSVGALAISNYERTLRGRSRRSRVVGDLGGGG